MVIFHSYMLVYQRVQDVTNKKQTAWQDFAKIYAVQQCDMVKFYIHLTRSGKCYKFLMLLFLGPGSVEVLRSLPSSIRKRVEKSEWSLTSPKVSNALSKAEIECKLWTLLHLALFQNRKILCEDALPCFLPTQNQKLLCFTSSSPFFNACFSWQDVEWLLTCMCVCVCVSFFYVGLFCRHIYPLVNIQKAIENGHRNSECSH